MPGGPYRVIDTDYKTYTLVHSCSIFLGVYKMEYNWVLTRQVFETGSEAWKTMQKKVLALIKNKYEFMGGSDKYWRPEWYVATKQGQNVCDYNLQFTGESKVD